MKVLIIFLSVFLFSLGCSSTSKNQPEKSQKVIYQPEDKEILNNVFTLCSEDINKPVSELIIKIGTYFKETPYVGHTLEFEPEQLVINLREMDCNTFAENCLAIAKTIKSGKLTFEKFTDELTNIRYRNGIIDDYPSRLHYFSDWIYNNEEKNLIKDVSSVIANTPYPLHVNFMSTHPQSYVQLKDSLLLPVIVSQEKNISTRKMYYIPENKISEVENQLKDGDIAGITTDIAGLDISHVVILVRINGRIHILHASSVAEKVVVSENTLEDYLLSSKRSTGIMVARPL